MGSVRELRLPEELDERLREWARYFKDRRRYERCASIEGRFNPFAPGAWDEGWGDPGPPARVHTEVRLKRVLETHEAIQAQERAYKWSITYAYCYPHLEKWQVLKFLRKYTGRRFSWASYLETLDIARIRVWSSLIGH